MTGSHNIKRNGTEVIGMFENENVDAECAEFQASMPERIGAGEDLQTDPHMLTCERCRSLVRDLEYIAEAARQLMPIEEEPRDELWANIQLAIERGEA
jgi:hypothetical protein